VIEVDLARSSVRALNERLHRLTPHTNELYWRVLSPNGAHAIAVGITQPVQVEIKGHVGYYCAGMNTAATVVVNGHAGTGLAENIMSGLVRVRGMPRNPPPPRAAADSSSSRAMPVPAAASR
jgi:methylamine---glutamate N-methyltransferase subunit B